MTISAQAPPARPPAQRAPNIRNFLGLGPPPDPAAVERGKTLFVTNCGFCHGANANGGESGPDLIRSVLVLHDEGKGELIGPVILNGRPDKGMPKFNMTREQISDMAAFLLSRSQGAANRMEYRILNVVTGNAAEGERYFRSRCGACHSPTGDLAQIASKYDAVTLQSRFMYPRTFSYGPAGPKSVGAAVRATVTLPSGQPVSGELQSIDDFSVSLRDASGDYRSFLLDEGSGIRVEVQDPLQGHIDLLKQYTDSDMHNVLAYLETLK